MPIDEPSRPNPWRRALCALLFVATGLSFLDRQVLSNLAPVVTRELKMTSLEYSYVNNAFLVTYAVMFLLGGRMIDLLGTRRGLAISVGLWSMASAAHATAQSALQLGVWRFMLGAGEGGCFPGAAKGVAQWFEHRQRALAMGVAIGGSSLGAVVAPKLSIELAEVIGWRGVFVTTGAIGAVWVAVWWALTWAAERRNQPERASEQDGIAAPAAAAPLPPGREASATLATLVTRGDVWGLALMRFIFDPVFYFYMFWIPKYLHEARGVSLERIADVAWIPFLALGVSNIAGGWVSDRLVRAGLPALAARKLMMGLAAALTCASSFAGWVDSLTAAIAMMTLLMFAHGFWITNYVTIISERFPQAAVGTVMGLAGTVGATGGMLANTAIGWSVDRFTYGPVWLASGLLYPAAFVVLLLALGRVTPETRANLS